MTSFGDIDDAELADFLRLIYDKTGYDFTEYSKNSMVRRFSRIMDSEGVDNLGKLRAKFFPDGDVARLVASLSIPTTEMFRDPDLYKTVRTNVLPLLKQLPLLRVWSAGCSTGEEAYSIAILLEEEGLYEHSRIYATDMNEVFVEKARAGVFPLRLMQDYTANYLDSGGSGEFSSYYTSGYGRAVFSEKVKRNIVFAHHNLVSDSSFNEFHLIFCRNVLIYFNGELQERVNVLLDESLCQSGFLILGEKESLRLSTIRGAYTQLYRPYKIYRKNA